MALPRGTDPYDTYTDQLVYFGARLAANPDTAALAEPVHALLAELDQAFSTLRDARRAELRARARRDHRVGLGDAQVRRFKRRVDVFGDRDLGRRLFPRGLAHAIAPRGRPQLARLAKLATAIDELSASPRIAAHPDGAELQALLDEGKAKLAELSAELTPIVEAWEAEAVDVTRAADTFAFLRRDGISRLGAVLGELRAKLGGDVRAAYAYTQQVRGRTNSTAEAVVEEGEGDKGDGGEDG